MNRMAEFREKAGMTRKELSEKTGLSLSLVRKLELGEYGGPTLATARVIVMKLKECGALKGYKGPAIDVVFPE